MGAAPDGSNRVWLGELQAGAESLKALLETERDALKRMDAERLADIISQKEAALHALRRRLHAAAPELASARKERPDATQRLRALLAEIRSLNELNRDLIETGLDYSGAMLRLLNPQPYTPASAMRPASAPVRAAGLRINREV